jgi:hypothetical protein
MYWKKWGVGDNVRKRIIIYLLIFCIGLTIVLTLRVTLWKPRLYGIGEAGGNLSAIRTAQESYRATNGVYVECKPSPPDGGTDGAPDTWVDAGGFTEIGFEPDGMVRFQYEVTISDDGQSFKATVIGDLDEDGKVAIYSVDKDSPEYPRYKKTGDEDDHQ